MRTICEVCKVEGYLQQLGDYYRVRHYGGKADNGKGLFSYHQQSKENVQEQIENIKDSETKSNVNTSTDQEDVQGNVQKSVQNKNQITLNFAENMDIASGRRLVWFRTLAFQANDPGFKSRRPHHNHIFLA
jgi:hypothetical protein